MLYFFYELETMTWGYDPKNQGSAKVFYYDGNLTDLVGTAPAIDLYHEFKLPEIKLTFNTKDSAPYFEELFPNGTVEECEEYEETIEELNLGEDEEITKLLGYSDNIQGDMQLECELVTNGLYCRDTSAYESPRGKELELTKHHWNIVQLAAVEKAEFELMFGDVGKIYFYIKEEDLQSRNFDNS
ncbi:hypothetical protein HLPCO_002112 [Haloplasma contractile SSD-17B]|uniref:Uncharacterized protein n=1 Tax=Haloplasma contractile SSD-17B TaxID=1033810 RepID=F7PRP7_9MOLU|nr:hypothetical protein HLPCO_002112 [Haloplasma contractile SSD-17B]